jgi:F-type H+-transporting ATPase subunit a
VRNFAAHLKRRMIKIKTLGFIVFAFLVSAGSAWASAHAEAEHASGPAAEQSKFDPTEMIMHHIKDAHSWHLMDWNGHAVSIDLPVILWTDHGLVSFSSAEFHHDNSGKVVVDRNGMSFVNHHEKIHFAGEEHHGTLIDLSITKNVVSLFVVAILLLLLFVSTARHYKKVGSNKAPTGMAGFVEPLVLFVRDEIARVYIGPKHVDRFTPYLLTLFFFIWLNNLLGLVPFFPGGANVTGNIAVTLVLAVITFILTNVNGTKDYWAHVFWMPGVPVALRPLLAVVEFIGLFTKPFSLMIRLFANISAGHIIILSLVSLVFILETVWVSPASILLSLFISSLELLVAALQAFVFTTLSALYIGTALEDHSHDHGHEAAH